jgi:DNA-binding transcriptional LysR family regulator
MGMDSRRKNLPPLDTLMFFEAAFRAGSFSAAASELYVSQAAVSKRIKQLEDWLGTELFERGARSLSPTQAGAALADPVTMALDYLQGAMDQVRSPRSATVRIAANSAVSVFWLFKRLKSFALGPASCPIETVVNDNPRQLLSEANDIGIIYASEVPQGWSGQRLMEEELAPVSSPEGAKRFFDDPTSLPLLDYHRHAPDWINWEVWEQRQEHSPLKGLASTMCQSYSHSIGQALDGVGIALASCSLLADELASGELCVLVAPTMKTGKGYFLVWQHRDEIRTQIDGLAAFLVES